MAEFEVRKHGANHWVLWEDGKITDLRVADKRAGELVVQRISKAFADGHDFAGAGADDDSGALETPELMARLWADLAEEENPTDAPLELHGHFWGGDEPVILLHTHEGSQVDHSHDIAVDHAPDSGSVDVDEEIESRATAFAEKLVGARNALRDAAAHLAEGPTSQLRKADREAIAAAWEHLKPGDPIGPQTDAAADTALSDAHPDAPPNATSTE